jgi:hypothetical protein
MPDMHPMELLLGMELAHGFGRIPMVTDAGDQVHVTEAKIQSTFALLVLSGSIGPSEVKCTWDSAMHLKSAP